MAGTRCALHRALLQAAACVARPVAVWGPVQRECHKPRSWELATLWHSARWQLSHCCAPVHGMHYVSSLHVLSGQALAPIGRDEEEVPPPSLALSILFQTVVHEAFHVRMVHLQVCQHKVLEQLPSRPLWALRPTLQSSQQSWAPVL